MRLVKKFQKSGKTDPVKKAYERTSFDWDKVKLQIKALGYNPAMYPDTLSYAEELLRNEGLIGDPLNIALASAIVETGGSPSKASSTGPDPTYWGIWQMSLDILPLNERVGGIEGALKLVKTLVELLSGLKHWTNGSYLTKEELEKKDAGKPYEWTKVGYDSRKQPYGVFWGTLPPRYTISSRLRLIPRNAKVQAYVNGLQRPLDRLDYEVKVAKVAKALENSIKK